MQSVRVQRTSTPNAVIGQARCFHIRRFVEIAAVEHHAIGQRGLVFAEILTA